MLAMELLSTISPTQRLIPVLYRFSDRRSHLIPTCIRKTDIQNRTAIPTGHLNGFVNRFEHVRFDQGTISQHPNADAVSIHQVAMLGQLRQLDFSHVHQSINLVS